MHIYFFQHIIPQLLKKAKVLKDMLQLTAKCDRLLFGDAFEETTTRQRLPIILHRDMGLCLRCPKRGYGPHWSFYISGRPLLSGRHRSAAGHPGY